MGKRADVGQFSCEMVGMMVGDYMHNTQQLSDQWWEGLNKMYGGEKKYDVTACPALNAPSMDKKCHHLYVPSSPIKSD